MTTFNVGDRVRLVSDRYAITKRGWEGTVVNSVKRVGDRDEVRVCFDKDSSIGYDIYTVDLTHIVTMPESFRTMVKTDGTRDAMFDLLEIPKFRKVFRDNWVSGKLPDGEEFSEAFTHALNLAMWDDDRKALYTFICNCMGWEDPAIDAKRKRINELKEELNRLEQEIESD